jgi:glycosyltransferase involved in cell wall biosynthesis
MRAVFIVPRFHPCPGGYENYVLWLTRYLRDRGDSVVVLTTTACDLESFWLRDCRSFSPGTENLEGIEVIRLPISYARWSRRAGRLLGLLPDWMLRAQFTAPSCAVPALRCELQNIPSIDVIHIGPLPYNRVMYEGVREGRRRGVRVVATPCTHFGEDEGRLVARHYTRAFQIELLNQCDSVLTLTAMERERLISAGLATQKVWATGAGIDPAAVSGGNAMEFCNFHGISGPVVVQIGTKAFDKGTVTLVDAMRSLWTAGSDAWLVLAGSSTSSFDAYLAERQNLCPRLLNLGTISDIQKRNLLAAATVLVHPSRVESLGLVYLEAWANGKPVIAANTAVSREVIDSGIDGLLVPFGDATALSSAIRRLLEDAPMRLAMGNAGQIKVQKRFTWKAAADRIYPFFRRQPMEVASGPYE